MNNTVEKWLFGFPKVKWLQYTGEVGKCTSYWCQIFSLCWLQRVVSLYTSDKHCCKSAIDRIISEWPTTTRTTNWSNDNCYSVYRQQLLVRLLARDERECLSQPHPSRSQLFIPILSAAPMFSQVVFTFPTQSHRLLPFPPAASLIFVSHRLVAVFMCIMKKNN